MEYSLAKAIEILDRTPRVLNELLRDLSSEWTSQNEGDQTWSPFDIIGHLIHGEKTDWLTRTKIILEQTSVPFEPFDRFAQFEESKGKNLNKLLDEFTELRGQNMIEFKKLDISEADLDLKGIHPELGAVTLKNLLATWVAHDLGHIAQISRVMAKLYKEEVGVWYQYLGILQN